MSNFYSISSTDDIHWHLGDDENKFLIKNMNEGQVETLERVIELAEGISKSVNDYPRVDKKNEQIQGAIDKVIGLCESTYSNEALIKLLKEYEIEEIPKYEELVDMYLELYETMLSCSFETKEVKKVRKILSRIIKH